MKQEYDKYTTEDHKVWSILFNKQMDVLAKRASKDFLKGLLTLGFEPEKVPNFDRLNEELEKRTGWQIYAVPGIVDNQKFFELFREKKFPATTWLRKMSQLEYLEEPDMFHDVFGHVPLLVNQPYVDFLEGLAHLALKDIEDEFSIEMITRIYWYTIEFGLIQVEKELKIYGAGILSSPGESIFSLSDTPPKHYFNIQELFHTPYIKHKMQDKYFVIESYDQLYKSLDDIELLLKKEKRLLANYTSELETR